MSFDVIIRFPPIHTHTLAVPSVVTIPGRLRAQRPDQVWTVDGDKYKVYVGRRLKVANPLTDMLASQFKPLLQVRGVAHNFVHCV